MKKYVVTKVIEMTENIQANSRQEAIDAFDETKGDYIKTNYKVYTNAYITADGYIYYHIPETF